jgi:hypothetical protein
MKHIRTGRAASIGLASRIGTSGQPDVAERPYFEAYHDRRLTTRVRDRRGIRAIPIPANTVEWMNPPPLTAPAVL